MALIPVRCPICGDEKVKKEERQMTENSVTCARMRIARQNLLFPAMHMTEKNRILRTKLLR